MNLVADREVSSLSLYSGATKQNGGNSLPLEKQALAVVTEDGTVELFTKPFSHPKDSQTPKGTASLKTRGKQMTRRADASVKVVRSEGSEALVPVVTASFQGPELVVAWADGGVIPVFERIRWLDDNTEELSFTGTKKVVKSKSGSALGSVTVNGTKSATESHVDESRAMVEQGNLAEDDIEMQDSRQDGDAASVSGSENDSDDGREAKKSSTDKEEKEHRRQKDTDSDVEMQNAENQDQEEEEEEETGEPSFGELLRAHASEEIDVEAELEDDVRMMGALVAGKKTNNAATVYQIPSGVSLSTVLTQSLKTNDNGMLESCFHTGDLSIIRTTIQRLDSSLAATLLQKLAERLSSRPGRYGHLLVWVQWTCVAHGGALAGKPELLKRMTTLFKVMDQRSSSLPSLLLLKGKLDMLDAQLGLRQSIRSGVEGMDSEDEDNVIYVEGQDEDEDDDEDQDSEAGITRNRKSAVTPITPRTKTIRDQAFDDEDESMMNGIASGADESENEEDLDDEEGDEDDDNNLLDTEAEESVGSSDAEESLEENEDDEDDEDEDSTGSMVDFIADSEEEGESEDEDRSVPQPPPSKKARLQGGKGKNKSRR